MLQLHIIFSQNCRSMSIAQSINTLRTAGNSHLIHTHKKKNWPLKGKVHLTQAECFHSRTAHGSIQSAFSIGSPQFLFSFVQNKLVKLSNTQTLHKLQLSMCCCPYLIRFILGKLMETWRAVCQSSFGSIWPID